MKKHMSAFVSFNLATLSRVAAVCEHPAKSRIKYLSRLFWSWLSFGAILLAAPTLRGETINYTPNDFDISIFFGCNCTCFCETNTVDTNNPVSVFLTANHVAFITSSAVMPAIGQKVPPHWTEYLDTCPTPSDPSGGSSFNIGYGPEGWTDTQSRNNSQGSTTSTPVGLYSLNYPIQFPWLNYYFYADHLPPDANPTGQLPLPTSAQQQKCQPYPWDVNLKLQFQNNQFYYMEQQLVVGYAPEFDGQPLKTPVTYVETNSLLTISLYCTNGGVVSVLPLPVSRFIITATLLPDNIPAPLSLSDGWTFTPNFYTNWSWPLTFDDLTAPNALSSPPGAAGTVQAKLDLGAGNGLNNKTVDKVNLLVRADRAYQLALTYYLNGQGIETLLVTNTGVVPPCTNVSFVFYTDICSFTNPTPHLCWATNIGTVDMMGAPDNPPGITMWALGPNNNLFSTTLTGSALTPLPAPYVLPVFMVNLQSANFRKWATESLDHGTAYEYFRSPSVYPVNEVCSTIVDLTDDFVICPTNPAIVKGTVTLNGCVDTNYYNGQAALSFLKFADYISGLPYDPAGIPTVGAADERLQYVSSIQATNGAQIPSPFNNGDGFAITEFDNPGGFTAVNNYSGQYSLKLGGLKSQPCVWNVNDLHLVFGTPVNLDYHVFETTSRYTNVNISCGTIVTNNIALCFGLKRIQVVNAHHIPIPASLIYHDAVVHVSGTGPGYIVGSLDIKNVPFVMDPYDNHADVDLFLPAGDYQYTADVNRWGTINGVYQYVSTLHLDVTNYFTVTCCTNPCVLVVDCPTNKAVSCATNWTFDLPTVHTNCCGTNYSISIFGNDVTTSNGPCSTTNTRTWLITDCNGHTSFCSQTVTVAPPSSYTLTLHPGVNLIANQLNHAGGNACDLLFPNNGSRDGDQLLFYNGCTNVGFTTYTIDSSFATGYADATDSFGVPAPTLSPGQGVFYVNNSGSPETVTFIGTPVCPPTPVPLCPCGTLTLVSYKLDCLGTYEGITGLQPQQGVKVLRWNGSGYTTNTFTSGAWTPGTPVLNVGEAAFILIPCPINPTNPLPAINIGTLSGTTASATFNLGPGNGTFTFSNNAWSVSGGNYNYTLQTTTNLQSPNWMTVCNAIPTIGYTFTNVGPVNFYRLQLQTNQ